MSLTRLGVDESEEAVSHLATRIQTVHQAQTESRKRESVPDQVDTRKRRAQERNRHHDAIKSLRLRRNIVTRVVRGIKSSFYGVYGKNDEIKEFI